MKRILSIILVLILVFSMSASTYAFERDSSHQKFSQIDFEEEVRAAGRIIAEEKGLLVEPETLENYKSVYTNRVAATSDEKEVSSFYADVKNYSINP